MCGLTSSDSVWRGQIVLLVRIWVISLPLRAFCAIVIYTMKYDKIWNYFSTGIAKVPACNSDKRSAKTVTGALQQFSKNAEGVQDERGDSTQSTYLIWRNGLDYQCLWLIEVEHFSKCSEWHSRYKDTSDYSEDLGCTCKVSSAQTTAECHNGLTKIQLWG